MDSDDNFNNDRFFVFGFFGAILISSNSTIINDNFK